LRDGLEFLEAAMIDIDINQHYRLVWHFVNRYRPGDEDLFQVGCIGLWKAAQRYDPSRGVRFSSYAGRWILNCILTELARRNEYRVAEEDIGELRLIDEDADPAAIVDSRLAAEWLQQRLELLTPEVRELVVLWAEGMKPREISVITGIPAKAVSERLTRALKKMRAATA
jgi:RNA polymerase sigma factor (sigma-70 family)